MQYEIEEAVDAAERGDDEQRACAAAQDASAVESDEQCRSGGCDEVGRAEGNELRKREQPEIEQAQCRADEQVVQRVQPKRREHFEEEERGEKQCDEKRAMFDGAFDGSIAVDGRDEIDAEARGLDLLAVENRVVG